MRLIGFMLAIALAMAVLKLFAAVIALLIVGALVWSAIACPKETLGWLVGLTSLEVAVQHPLLAMCFIGVAILAGAICSR